jgi:hypothetical protein
MTPTSDRDAAAELARRIKSFEYDPLKEDEVDRAPSDKPPAFAEMLMSKGPTSIESAAELNESDWQLICRALEHYASCGSG